MNILDFTRSLASPKPGLLRGNDWNSPASEKPGYVLFDVFVIPVINCQPQRIDSGVR